MRIWFQWCQSWLLEDEYVYVGIGGYKHAHTHPWKGWTVFIVLYKWMIQLNYVSDWDTYDRKRNYFKYRSKKPNVQKQ